jgi:hypothetical protein
MKLKFKMIHIIIYSESKLEKTPVKVLNLLSR